MLSILKNICAQWGSLAQLTIATLVLLFATAISAHAGPTPNNSLPDSDDSAFVPTTSAELFFVVTQGHPHSAWANLHAYCGGDPVNRSDPTGLDWEWQSSGVLAAGGEWKYVEGTDPFVPLPQFAPDDVGGVNYVGAKEYRDVRDASSRGAMQSQSDGLARTDGLASLMVAGAFQTNFANKMGPFTASPYFLGFAASNPELARSIAPAIIATGSSDPQSLEMGNRAFANAVQQNARLDGAFEGVDNFYAHKAWLNEQARKSEQNSQLALSLLSFAAGGVGGIEVGAIQVVSRELSVIGKLTEAVSASRPVQSASDLFGILRTGSIESVRDFTNGLRNWRVVRNAKSWQGKGAYPGVDDFRAVILPAGSRLWGGAPGQSEFYTTTSAVANSGRIASSMFGSMQVGAHAVRGFRPGMTLYTLDRDLRVALGLVRANPQFGPGGAVQIFIPEFRSVLTPVRTLLLER